MTTMISPLSRMRYGYTPGVSRTLESLRSESAPWQVRVLHPELLDRFISLAFQHPAVEDHGPDKHGLPILSTRWGIGGGGRDPVRQLAEFHRRHTPAYLPGRPSRMYQGKRYWLLPGMAPYAPPGNSVHEEGTLGEHAGAIDAVGWQDRWHLRDGEKVVRDAGLIVFDRVNGEPWHFQLAEYGTRRSTAVGRWADGVRPRRMDRVFEAPTGDGRAISSSSSSSSSLAGFMQRWADVPPRDMPILVLGGKRYEGATRYLEYFIRDYLHMDTVSNGYYGHVDGAAVTRIKERVFGDTTGSTVVGPHVWAWVSRCVRERPNFDDWFGVWPVVDKPVVNLNSAGRGVVMYVEGSLGLNVDGLYSSTDRSAFRKFKVALGSTSDDVAGPHVWRAIDSMHGP